MVTVDEETQAKEFLKRAEIRTMRKDLQALREVDALGERDKIAKIKTLEEQLEEKRTADQMAVPVKPKKDEIAQRQEILERNEGQERIAEKDLKSYATEEERQQIFLLESQRLAFEKQIDAIDKERDPALKLEKNKLLLQKRDQQARLNTILEQEKKLEDEQKFVAEKEQTSTIASQRKGLEQSRSDLDKKIQDVEKKRWAVEKEIENTDNQISQVDKSSDQNVTEKNGLRDKALGVDKLLREIYSVVMAREEAKRRGLAKEQVTKKEELAETRLENKEKIQRQQWNRSADTALTQIPVPIKKQSFADENKAREKFLQDVEQGTNK